ncbi:hypothetical protein BKA65DRAFT_59217 [Rhexocercosporidium sp. MPI-PUGE-AT-0058]|nr:hypothetical protein BKA65DRAFT_59217 [Rhexocercosporidium sp. MPI-PUGE-AT-0058]
MESRHLEGFPSLAHFISEDADAAIFRSFNELGARNLLYLQSNVNELEIKLKRLDREDFDNRSKIAGLKISAREYRCLKSAGAICDEAGTREERHSGGEVGTIRQTLDRGSYFRQRLELHSKIKEAMREYREALIQEQQIRSLKTPPKRSLSAFKYFFARKDGNILLGDDENLFRDLDHPTDLVSLNTSEDDRLNRFLRYTCGYCFRDRRRKPYPDLDIFYYSERAIHLTGYIVATILSGVLLVGAMLCLSLVYNRDWELRLGMVALFTSLFAIVVGILTNARRAELFGSTAAYAAVLVVYVSGNLGPPGPNVTDGSNVN